MKTLFLTLTLSLLPFNMVVGETIYTNGGMLWSDSAYREDHRADTIIHGYDPDLYYIESIDTTQRGAFVITDPIGRPVDTVFSDDPNWTLFYITTIDTTWSKYITGKFTKEQWRVLQEKMGEWLEPISYWHEDSAVWRELEWLMDVITDSVGGRND